VVFIRYAGARGLQARFEGALHQLIEDDGTLRYTSPEVELSMDAETLDVLGSAVRGHPGDVDLVDPDHLGAMIVLFRSFAESMPEFPFREVNQRQMP